MSKLSSREGECYIWSSTEKKPIPAKWAEAWANRGLMCNKDGFFLCDECGVLSTNGCDQCNSEWCDKHSNFHAHRCTPEKGSAASSAAAKKSKKKKAASKRKKQQVVDEDEQAVADASAENTETEPTEQKKPKITSWRDVFAPPEHHLPPAEKAQFYRNKAAEAIAEAEKIEQDLKRARLTPPFQLFHGAMIDGEAQELWPFEDAVQENKWEKELGTRIKQSEKWKWGILKPDGPLYLIDYTDENMMTVYRNITVVSNDPEPIQVEEKVIEW